MFKVGIVGAGWVAHRVHLPHFAASRETCLVGITDPEPSTIAVAQKWNTRFYPTLVELLPDVDLVIVCSPGPTHYTIVRACLQAGKHVICEKPLAMHAEEAETLLLLARRNGLGLLCCMTNRYRTDVMKMADCIRKGSIGSLRLLTLSWLRTRGIPARPGPLSQGVLWDLGSHLADLALWMTDWDADEMELTAHATKVSAHDETSVASWYAGPQPDVPSMAYDTVFLNVDGPGNALCRIEASWNSGLPRDECRLLAVGDEGALMLRTVFGWSPHRQMLRGPALSISRKANSWESLHIQDREHKEYSEQFTHLLGSVEGSSWISDIVPTVKSIQLLERAQEIIDRKLVT
ncbi:Gfo/Idh/MocA family protein [Streptomyces asiaticus]|uniref:Gfo/Idh/MocA family protein n=1 Tax=Streptomyces asiaticus TaxID=114695 RepID=UPI003F672EA4